MLGAIALELYNLDVSLVIQFRGSRDVAVEHAYRNDVARSRNTTAVNISDEDGLDAGTQHVTNLLLNVFSGVVDDRVSNRRDVVLGNEDGFLDHDDLLKIGCGVSL